MDFIYLGSIFSLQDLHLGRHGIEGHELSDDNCILVQRFDPFLSKMAKLKSDEQLCSDEDTIGFFIAKFVKIGHEPLSTL